MMIQLCMSLAAAIAVNSPADWAERTAELRKRIEAKECLIVPAAELQRSTRDVKVVHEAGDVYVFEATADGIKFWSWALKTSEFGRRLAQQGSI